MKFYPESVETAAQAREYIGATPGVFIYLVGSMGDHYKGKSVVIPSGHQAKLEEIYIEPSGHWMVRYNMLEGRGHPFGCCTLDTFKAIWTLTPPEVPPAPMSRGEHLVADTLGQLMT